MKIQRVLRNVFALTSGVTLVGATLTGALAYDLSTYPTQFVTNGVFDSKIVVGEHAIAPDILGAVEIAASLQAASTTKTPISNAAYLTGDVKSINAQKLQLRKKPTNLFSAKDLKALKTRNITNPRGTTQGVQVLRFGMTGFSPLSVNYAEDDDNHLQDFMVLNDDAPFFEWEQQFTDGLESQRDDDGKLADYEDVLIGLVGAEATIVSSEIAEDGTDFTMELMSGSVAGTLREGESRDYVIGGKEYTVTLVFVSDPNSGDTEVKFSVNGELTHALQAGDIETVSDGMRIGIREILVNSREGAASFFLGARAVTVTDPTPTTENFDGTVEVDDESISEGSFQIVGYFNEANSTFRMAWMRYRYTADPEDGSTIFLPRDHTLREKLDTPEGLISDIDVHYHGFYPTDRKDMKITASGDDQYQMTFFNVDGKKYEMPLLSNKDGVWKYGTEDDDLVFVEGANAATHNIGFQDYFILSGVRTGNDADKSVTHVFRYTDYDENNRVLEFESQADKSIFKVPLSADGIGYFIPAANVHKVNVSDLTASEPTLNIDLDADGGYADTVKIVAWGGVIINPAQLVYLNSTTTTTLAGSDIGTLVGNGMTISGYPGFVDGDGSVRIGAQVLAKRFDTPLTDEVFNWTITQAEGNEVDLSFTSDQYEGPINTDTSNDNYGFIFNTLEDDDEHSKGMTDYGVILDQYDPDNNPSELTLSIPATQQYAQLFVTVGPVDHNTPPPSTEKINPIGVGFAMLDTDAQALIRKENLIVVGGPCANTVAMALLGDPADCTEGFTQGEGSIRTFLTEDHVALLVAGFGALETEGASRLLAAYRTAKLSGESVTVLVPDLAHVTVKPSS